MVALVAGLPEDAAVWREVRPYWSQQEELLATMAEVMDRRLLDLIGVVVEVASGKKAKLPKSLEIKHKDRPGHAPRPKRQPTNDLSKMSRFMRKMEGR